MPTISRSRVHPLVTPSTALLTRARASPCTAACESFSRTATRCPSFCSTLMPAGRAVSSLPFGPCTSTVLPSNFTVTPWGIGIGFFPILDISFQLSAFSSQLSPIASLLQGRRLITDDFFSAKSRLPNLAQQFAAHAFLAGLATGHHSARRGENIDSHSAQDSWNLAAPHVDPAPGPRYALRL